MANPGDLSSNKIKNSYQRLVQYERADFEMYDGTGSRVNDLNIPNSITSSNMSIGTLDVTSLTASRVRISEELSNSGSTWLGSSVCGDTTHITGHTWITGSLTVSHSCTFRNIGQAKFIYLDNPVIEDQKPAVVNRGTGTGQYNVPRFGGQDAALDVYGNAVITGSLIVLDTIWAQEFHSEVVSQSVIYTSGSTKFGAESDDIMTITGSMFQSGSDSYFLNAVGIGTTGSLKAGSYLEPGQDNPVELSHLLTIADPGHNYGDGDAGVEGYKSGKIAHWSYRNLANDAVRIYDKNRGEDVLNVNAVYANIFLGSATGSRADLSSTLHEGKGGQYRVAINAPSSSALPSDSNLFVSSSAHARTRIESSGSDASASLLLKSGLSHWEISTMSGSGSSTMGPRRATHTESLSIRGYTSPHTYARKEFIKVSHTGDVGLGINVFDNQVGGTEPSTRLHVSHSDSTLATFESSHDQVAIELKTNSGTGKPGYSSKFIAMKDDKLIMGHHVSKSEGGGRGLQLNDPNHSFIISGSKGHIGVRMNPASGSGLGVTGNAFSQEFNISGSINIIRGRYSASSWKLDADGKMHDIAYHLADGTNGIYFNQDKTLFLSGSSAHTNYIYGGNGAGGSLTTGYSNILIGWEAGKAITTGNRNTIIGNTAFDTSTLGALNTGVGYGNFAWAELAADGNTAVGINNQSRLTTGDYNLSMGYATLQNNRDGQDNIAIGRDAGRTVNSGSYNLFLGARAGYGTHSRGNSIDQQQSYNMAIGYYAHIAYKDEYDAVIYNAAAIGKNAVVSQSDSMVFGPAHDSALTNGGHRPRFRIGMGGITMPNATLEVSGTVNFTGSLMVSGSHGTAKYNKRSGSLKVSGSGVFIQTHYDSIRYTGLGWTEKYSANPKSRGGALAVYGKSFHYGTMRISGSNNENPDAKGSISNPSMSALMISGNQYNHGDVDVTGSIFVQNSGSFKNAMVEEVLTIGQNAHWHTSPEVNSQADVALDVFKPAGGEFAASFNGVVSMSHNLIFNNSASIMVGGVGVEQQILFRKDTNNAHRFYNNDAPTYFFTGSKTNGVEDELTHTVPALTISGSNASITTYGSHADLKNDYNKGAKIGIGTISASKALTVKGSISASGDLFVDKFFIGSGSGNGDNSIDRIAVFSASMISASNFRFGYHENPNETSWMKIDPYHKRTHKTKHAQDSMAGNSSVFVGIKTTQQVAMRTTTLGYDAGPTISGSGNIVVGYSAGVGMRAGEQDNNIVIGQEAAANFWSGSSNVIIGANAATKFGSISDGSGSAVNLPGVNHWCNPKHNVIVGDSAAQNLSSSGQNVIIGAFAGGITGSSSDLESSISGSVFIGTHAGGNMLGTGHAGSIKRHPFGNIGIGHRISMASPSGSYQLNIGNVIWATGSGDMQYVGIGHNTNPTVTKPTKALQVLGDISGSGALVVGDQNVNNGGFISASKGGGGMNLLIKDGGTSPGHPLFRMWNKGIGQVTMSLTDEAITNGGPVFSMDIGDAGSSTTSKGQYLWKLDASPYMRLSGSNLALGNITNEIYDNKSRLTVDGHISCSRTVFIGHGDPALKDQGPAGDVSAVGFPFISASNGNISMSGWISASAIEVYGNVLNSGNQSSIHLQRGHISASGTISGSLVKAVTGSFRTLHGTNSSSLVIEQNNPLGTNIAITSGSAKEDPFHATAPPFVFGLQPHIKVLSAEPNNLANIVNNINDIGGGSSIWEMDEDNSAAIAISKQNVFPYGSVGLSTGASAGHQTALSTATLPVSCIGGGSGAPWWAKIKFALRDHDGMEFFWGVSEARFDTDSFHLDAAAGGADRVGFVKPIHDEDYVGLASSKNGGGTISTAFDTAQTYNIDNIVVEYGMHWDGLGAIRFYAAKADSGTKGNINAPMQLIHTYTTSAGIPDAPMYFGLFIENGVGSAAKTADIEYMSIATQQGATSLFP